MDVFTAPAEHKYNYTLTGANSQVLSISLKAGEQAHAEPGSMMMMSNEIETDVECKCYMMHITV